MWPREKKLKDIKVDRSDVRSMRRALGEMQHHSPWVRNVAHMALYQGLSGEDVYTVLAYELLLENERLKDLVLDAAMLQPRMYVMDAEAFKPAPAADTTAEDALMDIWRRSHSLKFDGKSGRAVMEEVLLKLGRIRKVGDRYEEVPRT